MKAEVVRIVPATAVHGDGWARMRADLWPDATMSEHLAEITATLADPADLVGFIAVDEAGTTVGFVEAALRHDYVNGCDTSPVAFVEGLYVVPENRRAGIARKLVQAVADWGRARGCAEMASDADLANHASHAVHAAIGFKETERVVYFRKQLDV